jgi:hypothetical protein
MVKYGNTTGFELSILICVGLSVVPMVEFTVEQLGNTNVVILLELHFQNPWSFIWLKNLLKTRDINMTWRHVE